jgi:hypothetical protein
MIEWTGGREFARVMREVLVDANFGNYALD